MFSGSIDAAVVPATVPTETGRPPTRPSSTSSDRSIPMGAGIPVRFPRHRPSGRAGLMGAGCGSMEKGKDIYPESNASSQEYLEF